MIKFLIGFITAVVNDFLFYFRKSLKESNEQIDMKAYLLDNAFNDEEEEVSEEETVDGIFEDFVGNEGVVLQLKRFINYSRSKNIKTLPNIGFFGPKSTGKTELSRRVAKCLDLPVLTLSRSTLNSEESFFDTVSAEIEEYADGTLVAPPMIIFIDEVHVLPRRIQDSLLQCLEEGGDRTFRSKKGDIDTSNITFIVATTDPGKLVEAFKSRFTNFYLDPYSVRDIMNIMKAKIDSDSKIDPAAKLLDDDSLEFIARAAKAVPRKAIALLGQISMAVSMGEISPELSHIKKDLYRTMSCDQFGLVNIDRAYLKLLQETGGKVGVGLLCASLGMGRDNIEQDIEPWLIQNRWVERTAKGRQLTPKGIVFVENYIQGTN